MTEYQKWMSEQSDTFKQEILNDINKIKENFVDEKYRPIDLDELKRLDNQYNS